MRRAIALILTAAGCGAALAAAGCSSNAGKAPAGPPTRLVYVMRDTSRSWTADSTRQPEEVSVAFSWPRVTAAPGAAAAESINAFVKATLVAPYTKAGTVASLDSAMTEFINDYKRYRHDFPTAPSGWYLKRTVDVIGDTAGVASLSIYEESFGGGAHPNSATRLVVFDEHTGRHLTLADLVTPAGRDSLERLGEAEFRRTRQIPADQKLAAAGFWFKDDRFRLNDNFAVTSRGFVFLFNDYEVGPHSFGPTQIVLPWNTVLGLIRSDGPLGKLAGTAGPA